MACPICQQRKAKRACPAKGEPICSLCCGREREESISCPFDCSYLQDARVREMGALEPEEAAHPDVRIERQFLDEHEKLVEAVARAALLGSLDTPGALDRDLRDALDAQTRTHKTLAGGIYYETRPDSAFARSISEAIKAGVEAFREEETETLGMSRMRDGDVVKALVFLLRMAQDRDNGRAKGRSFLHLLARQFDMEKEAPSATAGGLIVPGR